MLCQSATSDHLGLTHELWLFCALLKTQQFCTCYNEWYSLPSASQPPPTCPLSILYDIGGVQKKCLKIHQF